MMLQALLCLAAALPGRLLAGPERSASEVESGSPCRLPPMQAARDRLERARAMRTALYRRPAPDRPEGLSAVVEAYRSVYQGHDTPGEVTGEAAFRAGELLRVFGWMGPEYLDAALVEFDLASLLGRGTPFEARAVLETGHIHRRRSNLVRAVEAYRGLAGNASASTGRRDEAAIWEGRVLITLGRYPEARGALGPVAERGRNPLDRVRAHDYLIRAWIGAGDLEAAAGALGECRAALGPISGEATEMGRRVRSALERMTAVAALQRAITLRRQARRKEGLRTG